MQTIKCVAVGDGAVGKTCMLISYVNGYTPGEYIPTVFDNFSHTIVINGREIRLELWDTAGQENYDRLRPLAYPSSDAILVCFSIVTPSSYKNVELKWIPEIKHFCPHSKIILVGTKYDSREDPQTLELLRMTNEIPITYTQGLLLAERIGAFRYVECSSFAGVGLSQIFEAAVEAVLQVPKRVKKRRLRCAIL